MAGKDTQNKAPGVGAGFTSPNAPDFNQRTTFKSSPVRRAGFKPPKPAGGGLTPVRGVGELKGETPEGPNPGEWMGGLGIKPQPTNPQLTPVRDNPGAVIPNPPPVPTGPINPFSPVNPQPVSPVIGPPPPFTPSNPPGAPGGNMNDPYGRRDLYTDMLGKAKRANPAATVNNSFDPEVAAFMHYYGLS